MHPNGLSVLLAAGPGRQSAEVPRVAATLAARGYRVTVYAPGELRFLPDLVEGRLVHRVKQAAVAVAIGGFAEPLPMPVEGLGDGSGYEVDLDGLLVRLRRYARPQDLAGMRVLVTAGPTAEPIDPVRFISNHSTGRMGYAIAQAAADRGATVTLVSGPSTLPAPAGPELVRVTTAAELYEAVKARVEAVDIVVMSAAVADYRVAEVAAEKIKKTEEAPTLRLVRTEDVLAWLGAWRGDRTTPVLVGFAMETQDVEANAAGKLRKKRCDLVVANDLREPGAGFGHDTNRVTLVGRDGVERLPLLSKLEVGDAILDRAGRLLGR